MIKYKDLIEKTMPPEKKERELIDPIDYYTIRPISNIISIPFIEKNIKPTTVTKISLIFPILALSFFMINDSWYFLLGWIMIKIWAVLDGVDGNIARYNNQTSIIGDLWDMAIGDISQIVFYIGMGIAAYYRGDILLEHIDRVYYLFMGPFVGLCRIFPRMIMYKRWFYQGKDSTNFISSRNSYGLMRKLAFNITSIIGLGSFIFLASYYLKLSGSCMVVYFIINFTIGVYSTFSVLKE